MGYLARAQSYTAELLWAPPLRWTRAADTTWSRYRVFWLYSKTGLPSLSHKVDGNISGHVKYIIVNDIVNAAIVKYIVRILRLIQSQIEGRTTSPASIEEYAYSLFLAFIFFYDLSDLLLSILGYRDHRMFLSRLWYMYRIISLSLISSKKLVSLTRYQPVPPPGLR